jgi:hypothetical protein
MATKKTIITKTQSFLFIWTMFRKWRKPNQYLFAKLNGFTEAEFYDFSALSKV